MSVLCLYCVTSVSVSVLRECVCLYCVSVSVLCECVSRAARARSVYMQQGDNPDPPLTQGDNPDLPLRQGDSPDPPLTQGDNLDPPLTQGDNPDPPLTQGDNPDLPRRHEKAMVNGAEDQTQTAIPNEHVTSPPPPLCLKQTLPCIQTCTKYENSQDIICNTVICTQYIQKGK